MAERLQIQLARARAKLTALSPRAQGVVIPLDRPILLVGSSSKVHLRLRSQRIEDVHAAVLNADGCVRAFDLNTLSRIVVEDEQVSEAALRDGDRFLVGRVGFRYTDEGEGGGGGEAADAGAKARAAADVSAGAGAGAGADPGPGAGASHSRAGDGCERDNPPAAVLELNGQTHELRRRVLLVGRRPGCDLVLGDPTSLEKHAVLFHAGDTWYVRGLDPKVKLALNGQRVLQAPLKEGDRLRMGVSEVRFVGSLPAVESRIAADARARLSVHEGRPTSEAEARAPGVTEGRVPTIAESRTQPEASTPAIEPEPTPRFVPPAQQREPAPQPIVGLTQPTSAQPAAPGLPTDLRRSAAGERVVEEDPLDKSPVPIDAADIETIDLDEVRNWGPLAVAVAADRHPSLLRPTRSGDAEVAPPKAQRKWGLWVAVACTLLLAAGVVLALLMYRP